jgi:hypothetical protein
MSGFESDQTIRMNLAQQFVSIDSSLEGFASCFPQFCATIDRVFNRVFRTRNLADRVIVSLGFVCLEDYEEILVLCSHGLGIGGLKLLRTFYERMVTLAYISKNPNEAEQLLEYNAINAGRALNSARDLGQVDLFHISETDVDRISKAEDEARKKYGKRGRWSKLNLKDMAEKTDPNLLMLYITCYLFPTYQAHATLSAIETRTGLDSGGRLKYQPEAQIKFLHPVLRDSHNLMLWLLFTMNVHFQLHLDDVIKERFSDFPVAWRRHSQSPTKRNQQPNPSE